MARRRQGHGDRLRRTRHRVRSRARLARLDGRPAARRKRAIKAGEPLCTVLAAAATPRRGEAAGRAPHAKRCSPGRTRGPHDRLAAVSVNARAAASGRAAQGRCRGAADRRRARRARRDADRCRQPASRQHRGGLARRGNLHGRARHASSSFRAGDAALAVDAGGAHLRSGDRLPRQPICRLEALARRGQGRLLRARLRTGARARAHASRCSRISPIATSADDGDAGARERAAAAAADRRQGRAGLRPRAGPAHRSSMRRPRASPAARRSSRARSRSRCTRRMSSNFPLERIVDGMGAAPLAPPHPDFVTAMGRTNDAIIYGGQVHLFVTGPAERGARARRTSCRAKARATTAGRSRRSSGASTAISTRSIRCCSARPRSSSRRSTPARASARGAWT